MTSDYRRYLSRIVAYNYGARILLWWPDGTAEVRLRSGRIVTVPPTCGAIRLAHDADQADRMREGVGSLAVPD